MDLKNEIANKPPQKDLRVQKTYKALYDAMITMLVRQNFNEITVNDLCVTALISRATFYSHFNDKYNLLRYVLTNIRDAVIKDVHNYDILEKDINQFVASNKKLISHIINDANIETLMLLREFMSSIADLAIKRSEYDRTGPHYIILVNFFVGGLINILTWIVENNFPPEINMMNTYMYNMLEALTDWDLTQEDK